MSALPPMAVLPVPVVAKLPALAPMNVLPAAEEQQAWRNRLPPILTTPAPDPVVCGRFRMPEPPRVTVPPVSEIDDLTISQGVRYLDRLLLVPFPSVVTEHGLDGPEDCLPPVLGMELEVTTGLRLDKESAT